MSLPETVSTTDLCELFAISRKTVAAWTADGVLTRRARGRFNLIDAVQGHAKLMCDQAARAAGAQTTPGLETGAEARARLARLRADIAEAEYRRGKGEMVDEREIVAQLNQRMGVYWREVARIPNVIAGTLTFVDREMAMLIGRELQRCLSNIGYGRPPGENGPNTDYDDRAEHALMERQGKGVLSADGERIADEARARRAAKAQPARRS
jgi:phage terminase Nu1 subunit (DNA packaging protein)